MSSDTSQDNDRSGIVGLTMAERERIARIGDELREGIESLQDIGPAVSIFGSARSASDSSEYQGARQLARMLSAEGIAVVTGGGLTEVNMNVLMRANRPRLGKGPVGFDPGRGHRDGLGLRFLFCNVANNKPVAAVQGTKTVQYPPLKRLLFPGSRVAEDDTAIINNHHRRFHPLHH